MPQSKSYLSDLGGTKTQLTMHYPVPVLLGLLTRCDAPGCWYLGGPEGCMARRENLVAFLALADDGELTRSKKADYFLTPDEVECIRKTGRPRRNCPAPSRPTGRATVRTHDINRPPSGFEPGAPASVRELEVVGS